MNSTIREARPVRYHESRNPMPDVTKNGAKIAARKALIVFDMDGTLTESKHRMDRGMAHLLIKLLREKKVAVIGGGHYRPFRRQLIAFLPQEKAVFRNLFLFPTSAAAFYRFENGWRPVYRHTIPVRTKKKIMAILRETLRRAGYKQPKKTYGVLIEDRGPQITFSALGQRAPLPLKQRWNRMYDTLRLRATKALRRELPGCEVRTGGLTSIDVTEKGIDKAYGIRKMEKHLAVPRRNMLFLGDRIFPHGNDYEVVKTGVDFVRVQSPEETKRFLTQLLKIRSESKRGSV